MCMLQATPVAHILAHSDGPPRQLSYGKLEGAQQALGRRAQAGGWGDGGNDAWEELKSQQEMWFAVSMRFS